MKNFLMQAFQGKKENKPNTNISKELKVNKSNTNISKESKEKKIDIQKKSQNTKININAKNTNNKNINKVVNKPKLSQEILNANLAFIGMHPTTQNLTEENNGDKKDEINKKDNFIKNKNNFNKIKNNSTNSNNNNDNIDNNKKKYKEPFKPIGQYIIDKTLRFEENKSKKKIKNKNNAKSNEKQNNNKTINNNGNNEFNSDEEDELIKSKRKKINKVINISKKKKSAINKIRPGKSVVKEVITSLISDDNEKKDEKKEDNKDNKRKTISEQKPKVQSGNYVRLNLKKKYQEKKRVRPVNVRKTTLNHSRQLYKYQKQTIKNASTNDPYMGQGSTGLEDIDTLMKEQNDADKNDNSNLINTLVEKLPVFSQSYIEETQKTPLKAEELENNKDKDNNNEKINNNNNKIEKTPITNRLTTILKNSLQKKVSLDTELKFLSQEFKYLLSGQKEKVIKLNEIKKETLLSKKPLDTINEEVNNNINTNNSIDDKIDEENDNNEISKEDIEKMENEILLTVLKENFNYDNFNSELQLKAI